MASTIKKYVDPYREEDMLPPCKVIKSKKDYNRNKEENDILREIEEFVDYIPSNLKIEIWFSQ